MDYLEQSGKSNDKYRHQKIAKKLKNTYAVKGKITLHGILSPNISVHVHPV